MARVVEATAAADVATVRALFAEYARAVDELAPDTAEMKRLDVRRAHRGEGLGRALARTAIEAARQAGCKRVVLDTLPKMIEAQALYHALGFRPIAPYLETPTPGALCLGLSLSGSAAPDR